MITSDYYSSDSGEQNGRGSSALEEKGGGQWEEGTPVDTPQELGEGGGQDAGRAAEEAPTAASEVGRQREEVLVCILMNGMCVCLVVE